MTVLQDNVTPEIYGAGRFLSGDHDVNHCNEQGTLKAHAGADYLPGTILGLASSGADTGLLKPLDPAAVDGSQNFAGILWAYQKANAANKRVAYTARDVTVNANLLNYQVAVNAGQKAAIQVQAAAADVILRY